MSEMRPFLMTASDEIIAYFGEIATEMMAQFRVTRAEAVARINCHWREHHFSERGDLIFHQTPDYWAWRIFVQDTFEDGQLKRVVRAAPPVESGCWTIPS